MIGRMLSVDIYRLGKQKSTWIIPLATFAIIFVFGCLYGLIYGNASWLDGIHKSMIDSMNSVDGSGAMAGLFNIGVTSLAEYVVFIYQTQEVNLSVIAIIIFVSMYVSAVKRNGYSKNVAAQYNTFPYNFSQAAGLLGYSVLLTLIALCANVAAAPIFFEGIEPGNFVSVLLFFLVTSLLHWAACLMIVLICDMFRNATIGIVVGCLYTGFFATFLYAGINALIGLIAETDFRINHLFPFAFSLIIKYDDTWSYVYGAALAIIWAILFFVLKPLVRKKDIA
jgi:hypothetical protein